MCGLFGWQWHHMPCQKQRGAIVSILTSEMVERGKDSWGWYDPTQDRLERGLGKASKRRIVERMLGQRSLIGHTRWATTGKVTVGNAHPFRMQRIVGAHNGIVHNHADLQWRHDRDCAVDSQHIFLHLEEGLPLSDVEAYGAITYSWLHTPAEILLGRFNDGELSIAEIPRHGLIWASTEEAVCRAVMASGLSKDASLYTVKEGDLYVATGGRLFTTGQRLCFAKPQRFVCWDDWSDKDDEEQLLALLEEMRLS